jgi:hypothetical protein
MYRDRDTERIHLEPRLVSGLLQPARMDDFKRVAINWRRGVLTLPKSRESKQGLVVDCINAINRIDVDVGVELNRGLLALVINTGQDLKRVHLIKTIS